MANYYKKYSTLYFALQSRVFLQGKKKRTPARTTSYRCSLADENLFHQAQELQDAQNNANEAVQLNQTTKAGTPVFNWSSGQTGTDRSDSGCQYQIELVEGEPEGMPDPSLKTLTLTINEFANGQSAWTKNVSTSDGWYGQFVTSTTPAVTVASTDKTVNNMGWSSKRPWLQAGYNVADVSETLRTQIITFNRI